MHSFLSSHKTVKRTMEINREIDKTKTQNDVIQVKMIFLSVIDIILRYCIYGMYPATANLLHNNLANSLSCGESK